MRALDDRLRDTYMAAVEAGHNSANVAIHVGRDVWNRLHDLAGIEEESRSLFKGVGVAWGYPVVLETSWAPTTIKVMTVQVIL